MTEQELLFEAEVVPATAPQQPHSLFISYSAKDGAFVDRLQEALHASGIRTWRDQQDLQAGEISGQIDRAIRMNPTVLTVLSQASVGSDWFEYELETVRRLEKEIQEPVFCPISLDDSWRQMRPILRHYLERYTILDFSREENLERNLPRLVKGLWMYYWKGQQPAPRLPAAQVQAIDTLNSELVSYLRRNKKALYEIDPRTFEELVAEVLASFGWSVELTARTGDNGYDIFGANPAAPGVTSHWLIECKRYAPHRPVGVDIVRALIGSRVAHAPAGNLLLATTSYFTKGAYDIKNSRYDLEFRDYEGVLEWIDAYKPNPSGKLYLDSSKPIATP